MADLPDLFMRMMLAAYEDVGDTRRGMPFSESIVYESWMNSTAGIVERTKTSSWEYLCRSPIDGWDMASLTLIEHLVADPHETLYVGAGTGRMIAFMQSNGIACRGLDISPTSVELMARRGMECDLMDAQAMTYADDSFARVVLHGDGLVDSFADPTILIQEAARVASDGVIVAGYEIDEAESSPLTWGMAWGGEEYEGTFWAHPRVRIEAMLETAGMTLLLTKSFGEDWDPEPMGASPYGTMYLVEARW